MVRQRIKSALPRSKAPPDLAQLLAALHCHAAFLREQGGLVQELLENCPQSEVPQVLAMITDDVVWEKLGLEEEQIIDALTTRLGEHQQVIELLEVVEKETQALTGRVVRPGSPRTHRSDSEL